MKLFFKRSTTSFTKAKIKEGTTLGSRATSASGVVVKRGVDFLVNTCVLGLVATPKVTSFRLDATLVTATTFYKPERDSKQFCKAKFLEVTRFSSTKLGSLALGAYLS